MELIGLLILIAIILLFGKLFLLLLQAGIWLLVLPLKILGSVLGLVIGAVVLLAFFPLVLVALLPFILFFGFIGGCIYLLK